MTRDYVTEVVQGVYALTRLAFGGDRSFSGLPEGMLFMNRMQFGFYSVLARLDAEADYRAVETRFLQEAALAGSGAAAPLANPDTVTRNVP